MDFIHTHTQSAQASRFGEWAPHPRRDWVFIVIANAMILALLLVFDAGAYMSVVDSVSQTNIASLGSLGPSEEQLEIILSYNEALNSEHRSLLAQPLKITDPSK